MNAGEALDLIDRAENAGNDPEVIRLYSAITGMDGPVPIFWLGTLHDRLQLIGAKDDVLREMGEAFAEADLVKDAIDYVHEAWERTPYITASGVRSDIEAARLDYPHESRTAASFKETLPRCTIPLPERSDDRNLRQVSRSDELRWVGRVNAKLRGRDGWKKVALQRCDAADAAIYDESRVADEDWLATELPANYRPPRACCDKHGDQSLRRLRERAWKRRAKIRAIPTKCPTPAAVGRRKQTSNLAVIDIAPRRPNANAENLDEKSDAPWCKAGTAMQDVTEAAHSEKAHMLF